MRQMLTKIINFFQPNIVETDLENQDELKNFGNSHAKFASKVVKNTGKDFPNQIFHVKQLIDPDYRYSYNFSVVRPLKYILNNFNSFKNKTVLDFGCWSGATSYYISTQLDINVIGVENNKECLTFAKKSFIDKKVKFVEVVDTNINLNDESVDIVLANAVFANVFPDHHIPMLRELFRVLKNGGHMLIIDSNNPKALSVSNYLKNLYKDLEGPKGMYFKAREDYFIEIGYDKLNANKFAKETCYRTLDEIEIYLKGKLKPQKFELNSLKTPFSLSAPQGAPSNATDPDIYKKELNKLGCKVICSPSFPVDKNIQVKDSACFYLHGIKNS